jgi:Zn-dependent M16 (insulinase) family peptidase
MNRKWTTYMALLVSIVLTLSTVGLPVLAQEAALDVGDKTNGFVVQERSRLDLVNADVTLLEHEKTGALLMLVQNEDTNRTYDISFRTPVEDDSGIPHVFEHATLGGSQKYPSKALFFNLIHQTYNTYMNAMTTDLITTYPVASLSEKQLLKYVDYYTDSVFNPSIMEDESIFREEAWRYAMVDKDALLTIAGTVYTEMQGAYSIETASMFNFKKTLFPGSQAGNSHGGHPSQITTMTWQHLKDYHDAYYHPSNSLSILYGKIEDYAPFLTLLDGYFSAYDKKKFTFDDLGYTPLSAASEKTFEHPVEAGSDTTNGAVVYFGYALKDATAEDEAILDLLTTLLNNPSSPFQQTMKEKLPSASASCYYDNATPEVAVVFQASGMAAEDALLFQTVVEEALAGIREKGFDLAAVEAVAAATRLDLLLVTESPNIGPGIAPSIAYMWAATGDWQAYNRYVKNTENFLAFAEQGLYQQVIERHLTDNPRTALVVTAPAPGLKEQQDQALAEELAAQKAAMTEEEIAAIVEATAKQGEQPDDAAALVAQLQAVDVDTLPEERRIYDITDETGADNVRRLHAQADVSGVGQALLLLNAGAIPQDDLHWYRLYVDLLGKLDTARHDNASFSALLTRYLYQQEVRPTVYTGKNMDECHPYLRVSWIAMDEDMAPAYDLVYELLFETKLDNAAKVADVLSQVKASLKQAITNGSFQIQAYRAFASASPAFRYFNHLNFLDYYAFLEQAETLFAAEPETALKKLSEVQAFFHVRDGAISGFAGSADSAVTHREAADAFLNRLDTAQRAEAAYDLPAIADKEALVVDAAVQYNLIYAPYHALGLEGTSGDLDAVTRLVVDAFLYPQLRDQYGAYGVDHTAIEEGVYILSFRDPNVQETFDIYAALPGMIESMTLDQETLNGFILSAYSSYALSQGELSGALQALIGAVDEKPQERYLTWMRELKALTPEKVREYAAMYQALSDKGHRSTSGGANVIQQNEALYDRILNPFEVKEVSHDSLADVAQEEWYSEAVAFVLGNKAMSPMSEEAFGIDEAATVGDFTVALFTLAGMPTSAEEGMMILAQLGVLSAEDKADTVLTRERLADTLCSFLSKAAGQDIQTGLNPLPDLTDADQISPASLTNVQFMLHHGLLRVADSTLQPQAPATRADLAYAIWGVDKME